MVKYTRQHYIEIGGLLRRTKAKKTEVDRYVRMFKKDNPRFDAAKFRKFVKTGKK